MFSDSAMTIVSSNPIEVWIYAFLPCVWCSASVAVLQRADTPSKESYQLSVGFVVSD
jgi:hypothetical protein